MLGGQRTLAVDGEHVGGMAHSIEKRLKVRLKGSNVSAVVIVSVPSYKGI